MYNFNIGIYLTLLFIIIDKPEPESTIDAIKVKIGLKGKFAKNFLFYFMHDLLLIFITY